MPSVILTILKVIGIILLVLLVLLLTVLLLVLFVPVRYRLSGKYEDVPEGEACVTWLLRLIGVRAGYKDGIFANVRVLCFNIWSMEPGSGSGEDEEDMFAGLEEAEAEVSGGSPAEEESVPAAEPQPADDAGSGTETGPGEGELSPAVTESLPDTQHRPDFSGWQAEEASEGEQFRPWEKEPVPKRPKKPARPANAEGTAPAAAAEPGGGKIEAVRKKLEELTDKAASLKKKADGALAIVNHRRTQRLKDYLIRKIRRILREIIPRKYGGFVRFGFDDPFTTGQAASAAALLYPVYRDQISVQPLFDREEIAADLNCRGRIRLFVLVLAAAQVWFNRDFQYVFKRVRKYKKTLTEEDHG